MHTELGDLIVGSLMIACSVVGLFLLTGAQENERYIFVLSLVGWGAVFIFGIVRRCSGPREVLRVAVPAPGEQPHA